ncbi:hypothetical protein N7466_004803 [Penicillium verhagenii]|uniref:uncharacterized protein n=1 Tax=Penicillium verhagenii TaxID=1562060 RepID=UPI002545193B|nr:uncharacterized protein N7466_004803 [Penicillium verhagenii]KAJ5935256.1 hypothetical protein N7466_004803 [Penicillium verhagenii]
MQGSDTKQGPRDQWGNVKIPRLPDPSSSEADSDGWFQVPNGTASPERYSSLSGIAIVGLANLDKEDVEFTVETSYVELACSEGQFMSASVGNRGGLSVTCPDCGLICATGAYNRTAAFLGPPFPGLTAAQLADPSMTRPRSIVFNSSVFKSDLVGFLQTTCQVTQQHVETQIECAGNECNATKIRSSRTDHRSGNYTSFDDWGGFALDLISKSSVPGQAGVGDDPSISEGASTSELFIQNSTAIPAPSTDMLIMEGSYFNLSTIGNDVFATRASMLLNTALQVFTCPSCFAGNFPSNMSIYGPDYIPADGMAIMWKTYNLTIASAFDGGFPAMGQAPFMAASTNATVTSHTEVYRPRYGWIGALAGSVAVIGSLGLFSLCLRASTRIPNVFDPVMGLTYNNEYTPPAYQGELDSKDRAKLLQDERVRFGGVGFKDMKARIAFGEEAMVSIVDNKTLYHEQI